MKLTVKEWNVVINVLAKKEKELNEDLRLARADLNEWERSTELEGHDWNQDPTYIALTERKDNAWDEWHEVYSVLGRMEEQEF